MAIVDAYDDPNAESDLAVYRATFGLPPCTTDSGCFRKVDENGGTDLPHGNSGWAAEISLDLDMVSAICSSCHILLVEGTSSGFSDLGTAVDTAVRLGAEAVSNSYGAPEVQMNTAHDSYYDHPGVAVTVASGDRGFQVEYPASSPFVTAVGGTSLVRASNSRGWSETAWTGSGSGCSGYEAKPTWQTDAGCSMRTVADVSAVADPATGIAVYDTYKYRGWLVFGGTSVASPIIASVYALAGNELSLTAAKLAYTNTSDLYDVVSGSTAKCGTYLCTAVPGYDGPTGNGTPDGTNAF
ncbi:MAG TPA: S53 family peptidase [Acidimicrobiales bacterium]|nr:S53 family peptidase [Acidimicrobiales bacterium]